MSIFRVVHVSSICLKHYQLNSDWGICHIQSYKLLFLSIVMVNRKSVLYFKPSHVVVDNTKLISSISYHLFVAQNHGFWARGKILLAIFYNV